MQQCHMTMNKDSLHGINKQKDKKSYAINCFREQYKLIINCLIITVLDRAF